MIRLSQSRQSLLCAPSDELVPVMAMVNSGRIHNQGLMQGSRRRRLAPRWMGMGIAIVGLALGVAMRVQGAAANELDDEKATLQAAFTKAGLVSGFYEQCIRVP